MKNMFIMLNRFTKTGWLFTLSFAILSYGCATGPGDSSSSESSSSSGTERPVKYRYAVELLKGKEYAKAQDEFLSIEPRYKHADLYTNLAIIYLHKKQYEKAKIYIEKSVASNPANHVSQNIYGVILRNLGDFDKAVQAYNTSISKNAGYSDAYLNMAILYDIFMDSPKQALPYYEKYNELASNDTNVEKWLVDVKRRIK